MVSRNGVFMNTVVTIFQENAFLQTEWFYSAISAIVAILSFILALVSAIVAMVMWRIDAKQKLREEKIQTLSRIVQIDIELKEVYRVAWARITSYQEECKQKNILSKDLTRIKEEQVRMSIFQVIDILSDVHKHFNTFEMPLDETWETHFYHTFDPNRRKAFVQAFYKYQADGNFSKNFVAFVKEIIEYHRLNPDTPIQSPKE